MAPSPSVRQVDGVSILDWPATGSLEVPALGGALKELLERSPARHVLLNMASCEGMRADHIEALTEAFTVCRDRSCAIGMFAVRDRLARLLELAGIVRDVPPIMGRAEADALVAIRNGGASPAPAPAPAAAPAVLEFELDFGGAATAPTAKFDPAQLQQGMATGGGAGASRSAAQSDQDLLAVFWGDLTATGYTIGGPGGEAIMRACAAGPAQPAPAEPEPGVIDLGDTIPARKQFRTEVLPAFQLEEAPAASGWSAAPSGAVEVEFDAPAGAIGRSGLGEEFSPLDTGGTPSPAVLHARAQAQVSPPAQPTQAPAPAGPPFVPPLQVGAPTPPPARVYGGDDGDETIMFQPGALDAALLQAGVGAAPPPSFAAPPLPAPLPPVASPPPPIPPVAAPGAAAPPPARPAGAPLAPVADDEDEQDETIMFQPGALDAALLAEVAQAAGPETALPSAPVQPPPGLSEAAPADEGEAALRRFVLDHALTAPLHLEVLDCFAKAGERVLARNDVALSANGARGSVGEAIDQLVQSRLVRRTRSPRIRGGTGFLYSPSPSAHNTIGQLLRLWRSPAGRAKVSSWLPS